MSATSSSRSEINVIVKKSLASYSHFKVIIRFSLQNWENFGFHAKQLLDTTAVTKFFKCSICVLSLGFCSLCPTLRLQTESHDTKSSVAFDKKRNLQTSRLSLAVNWNKEIGKGLKNLQR